jgi:hypothetical protein
MQATCLMDKQIKHLHATLAHAERQAMRSVEPELLVAGHYQQSLRAMLSSIKTTADANVSTIEVEGEEISYINEFEQGDVQCVLATNQEGKAAKSLRPAAAMDTYNKYLAMVESFPDGIDEFSADYLQLPTQGYAGNNIVSAPRSAGTGSNDGNTPDKKVVRFAAVDNVREFEKRSSVADSASATLENRRDQRLLSVPLDAFSGKVVERVQGPSIPASAAPDTTSTGSKKRVSLFKQQMAAARDHQDYS